MPPRGGLQPAEVLVAEGVTRYTDPGPAPNSWVDHLGARHMSLGTYSIPAGGIDDQMPHREDEIYVVTQGRATLTVGNDTVPVAAGSAVHVPAGLPHRFVDVTEDLVVLVVFSPPYTGRQPGS
jgi:mannose-6-phosphate isomerase-like protein (cupin superfamily)